MPMSDLEGRLKELREEYAKTRYNKATNKHLGILRRKMADIRKEMEGKSARRGVGFAVRKSGDATVALVGFPNAGKSSLLVAITNAESRVAAYAFTTVEVIPGVMDYEGARIQILDVPGLIEGAGEGRGGGGPKVASVIRIADLLLIILDVNRPGGIYKLLDELQSLGIRVNGKRAEIAIENRRAGGLEIEALGHKIPARREITEVMNSYSIYSGRVVFHQNAGIEELIEFMDTGIVYIKALIILNKIDSVEAAFAEAVKKELENTTGIEVVPVSAARGTNLGSLKPKIFGRLGLIHVYLKPRDGKADLEKPLIMRRGSTVFDAARAVHSKAAKGLRHAYISGRSARFANQRVGREHLLEDGDQLTLVYER